MSGEKGKVDLNNIPPADDEDENLDSLDRGDGVDGSGQDDNDDNDENDGEGEGGKDDGKDKGAARDAKGRFERKKDGDKKDGKADIFAFHLDENSGLHGLFASNHPAGFAIEDLGTVQNKDATRTRIKMYVGMALKATHALAKLSNVKLPGAAPTVGG